MKDTLKKLSEQELAKRHVKGFLFEDVKKHGKAAMWHKLGEIYMDVRCGPDPDKKKSK